MISLYESKGRKEWVDLGKGISILLVVLFHCEEYLPIVDTGTKEIFSFFRMPFFFFLSGYVFTSDYREFSFGKKLKQIFRGIVWTYLIISTIIVVPKYLTNSEPVIYGFKSILLGWATWFVVSLGVAQLIFASVLNATKNLKYIGLFLFLSVGIGIFIKSITSETLPYQLDKVFFVVFFFGMGFFYRIYEDKFKNFISWRNLIVSVFLYGSLMMVESLFFKHSTTNVFWGQELNNFPMFMIYTICGIIMMLLLVNKLYVKHLNLICYIGANSLLFYYLNGGVIKFWRFFYEKLVSYFPINNIIGFVSVFIFVATTLFLIVYLVKKHCPILVGDKKAFNHYFPKFNW